LNDRYDHLMWLAWVVLVLHVAAFVVPLIGVRGIYKRAQRQLDDARQATAAAVAVLDWHEAERNRLAEIDYGSTERELGEEHLAAEYAARVSAARLTTKTYGDMDISLLTNGRSNLLALASAVQVAKIDAFWVITGLFFGLVANLVPTIWSVPSLVA